MRLLFGEPLERTNRLPVVAVAEVGPHVVATRIEVEGPRVAFVARVRNRRPTVAVRTGFVERSPAAEAGTREKDALRRIVTLSANNIAIDTIHCCPNPIALAVKVVELLLRRHPPITAPMLLCRIIFRR